MLYSNAVIFQDSTEKLSKETKPKPIEIVKKPLTEIQEFILSTDLRAKERRAFEVELQARYEKVEMLKQMDQERRFREEQEEYRRFRKLAEVKAQPIKKYKEVQVQPSGKVTEPISPKFHSLSKKRDGSSSKENNFSSDK